MINDELLLEGLKKCKSVGALAMVHAENGDAVFEGQKRMIELGITGPEGHALSRPPLVIFLSTNRCLLLILPMIGVCFVSLSLLPIPEKLHGSCSQNNCMWSLLT